MTSDPWPDRPAPSDVLELLSVFLSTPEARGSHSRGPRLGLPCAGSLPRLTDRLGGGGAVRFLNMALRSLAQVIFINNPLSGLLLLLSLSLQSVLMGLMAGLAIVAANATARLIGADPATSRQGIHGFNGALVGAAVAAFAALNTPQAVLAWAVAAAVGAALTTLLIESLGRWLVTRLALPPLTLPFCLVTWLLLALVAGPARAPLPLAPAAASVVADPSSWLPLGVLRGFGQVFLCSSLSSSLLVLAAVGVASPLAAGIGLLGGLVSSLTAGWIGMDPQALGAGLGSYNGVLCSIAIAGIFHAPVRASLVLGLLTAATSALVAQPLGTLLAMAGLPLLTAPFVVVSLLALLLVRRGLPSLLPVALHALLTPEEHRQRYRVSHDLLADFRRRLQLRLESRQSVAERLTAGTAEREHLQRLFHALDADADGRLSLSELDGLLRGQQRRRSSGLDLPEGIPAAVLESCDLNRDGQVELPEFAELMLRLRLLVEGRERLRTYLQPVDADGDARLGPNELSHLLISVGQAPLTSRERQHLFSPHGGALPWSALLERLLLT